MADTDRIRAVNGNIVESFDRLRIRYGSPRGGRRRFGVVEAVAVGLDVAFFNPVLALDAAAPANDVLAALDWVESLGVPASVVIDSAADPGVSGGLVKRGLQADDERMTVMSLDLDPRPVALIADVAKAPPDANVRTGGIDLAEAWWTALDAPEGMRSLFGAPLIGDPDVRISVADHEGEPAAGAMAIRSEGTLGVYAVWTAERARRHGLGRAVTSAVIRAGMAAWGSRIAILHSTEMGFPVYRSIGFEPLGSVVMYRRPPAAAGTGV